MDKSPCPSSRLHDLEVGEEVGVPVRVISALLDVQKGKTYSS
jgi:hypothetical protein